MLRTNIVPDPLAKELNDDIITCTIYVWLSSPIFFPLVRMHRSIDCLNLKDWVKNVFLIQTGEHNKCLNNQIRDLLVISTRRMQTMTQKVVDKWSYIFHNH